MPILTITEQHFLKILESHELITPTLLRALQQAKKSHSTQKRDSGKSYYEDHILPVGKLVIEHYVSQGQTVPEKAVIVAVLHDTIEDDPLYTELQCRQDFGDEICDMVCMLTKSDDDNKKDLTEDQIAQINVRVISEIQKKPFIVQLVKSADRYSNMANVEELNDILPLKYDRIVRETRNLFLPFVKNVSTYIYKEMKMKLESLE